MAKIDWPGAVRLGDLRTGTRHRYKGEEDIYIKGITCLSNECPGVVRIVRERDGLVYFVSEQFRVYLVTE